jgi:hypothetical protein
MKRQLQRLLPGALALLLFLPVWGASTFHHTGEILGTHAGERTLTLRVSGAEGKEVLVFHVPEEADIHEEKSGKELRFEDLKAGMRVTVHGTREEGRRRAREIRVRKGR